MICRKLLFFFAFLLFTLVASAQVKDAGLWVSSKGTIDIGKGLDLQFAPELRFDENITRLNGFFSDIGITKKINNAFSGIAEYRVGGKVEETWYNFRHRISIGISGKIDLGDFSFSALARVQMTPQGVNTDGDLDLRNVRRLKGAVKYKGFKKYDLSSSFELFNEVPLFQWSDWRWQASIERSLSKRKSVALGYLIQKQFASQDMDFVITASFKYVFKKKDKVKDPKRP